jgi:hypothetical protein
MGLPHLLQATGRQSWARNTTAAEAPSDLEDMARLKSEHPESLVN